MIVADSVKQKREYFGLSTKEFADALKLGKDGQRLVALWESGKEEPTAEQLDRINAFASNLPYTRKNDAPDFRFIDLFAGIGGIRIPFQELGGQCVFTSEWDKFAQKTYYANFADRPAGDITKIKSEEIPDFDVLLGGFPCQPFSQAGLHKGFSDTRGTLFFEIERIISEKRPKAFLLENVKQLKNHDGGRTFAVIVEHLKALNYSVDYCVLRACDFGVPQHRERIYIVGFDKNYYNIPDGYSFKFPDSLDVETRLGDILEENVDSKYTISQNLYEGHLRRRKENKEKGNGFGFSVFSPDAKYVNTLSARYYKDGSEILVDQGEGKCPRKLTPRECARLQGFPEYFVIPVSDAQAYKQFGNSVAVPVIREIAKKIKSEMNNLSSRGKEECHE